jgi:hypothetical protein
MGNAASPGARQKYVELLLVIHNYFCDYNECFKAKITKIAYEPQSQNEVWNTERSQFPGQLNLPSDVGSHTGWNL